MQPIELATGRVPCPDTPCNPDNQVVSIPSEKSGKARKRGHGKGTEKGSGTNVTDLSLGLGKSISSRGVRALRFHETASFRPQNPALGALGGSRPVAATAA